LTAARAANLWLAEGSVIVQQQAIRDHRQAMTNFFAGTHRRPTWRKAGRDEGFRIVHLRPGDVRRLSRHAGEVRIPKAGWVRFRWSRPVSADAKSCRITQDRARRWHVAFAVIPDPVPGPGTGQQAWYRCVACGFACNADVNAAINIAAGHAVTARGRSGLPERMNREPQLVLLQY
jgi:transposase